MIDPSQVEDATECLVCGGRGGWWSGEFREQCKHCKQTGWEPSATLRAVVARGRSEQSSEPAPISEPDS